MKKIHIITAVALLMFFSGCTDYLDETPDNRIEANTLDKVSELLVAAYPQGDYVFTDWMTDDSEYIVSNQQLTELTDVFLWKDLDELEDTNTPTNYWNSAYEAISQANAALEALDKIESDDIAYRNAIKGEALLCRAYAHFMLTCLFSNNYDEATAKSDLGIPYVSESENVLIKQYKRNTLFEDYVLIEKDLTDGFKLLSNEYYSGSKKYHFTTTAAKAFACRFYMYKGDYAESIKYADQILGVNTVNPVYLKDLNVLSNASGSIAQRNFFVNNSDASNILIVEKLIGVGLRTNYGYRTSTQVWRKLYWNANIWDGTDLRDNGYGKYAIETAKFKEEFYKESLTATTGRPFFVQAVFRGEELVFNRIESNIELNNFTAALTDLNVIGSSRYTGAKTLTLENIQTEYTTKDEAGNDLIPDEKTALMSLLLSEKRKEFLQEGMRWLDVKRHHIAIDHVTSDGDIITLEKDDLRKVLQIPQNASSRGIAKNPR